MKIFILWPTVRPDVFNNAVKLWLDRAVWPMEGKIFVDVKDRLQARKIIDKYGMAFKYSMMNTSLPKSLTFLTTHIYCDDKDIIVNAQDDYYPPYRWDEIIMKEFEDFDGAVCFNDGIQVYPNPVCTMPCLTFSALKKLNRIIFHPEYMHLYCDNEYYANVKQLGILKDVRQTNPTVFEHRHYSTGKRQADVIDERINSAEITDRATYERRMKLPLSERLKV
jgi:hypothetical protein